MTKPENLTAIQGLASYALSSTTRRRGFPLADGSLLNATYQALIATDSAAWDELTTEAIGAEEIMEFVIPQLAAIIGRGWETGSMGFLEVSFASGRLMQLAQTTSVAYLENAPEPQRQIQKDDGIVMIIPQGEEHLIGGIVTAYRLKKLGLDVAVSVLAPLDEILALIEHERATCICISIGTREMLAKANDLAAQLRADMPGCTIIFGGSVLATLDAQDETYDADLFSNDVEDVFAFLRTHSGQSSPKEHPPQEDPPQEDQGTP